jgi:general secretion pathway protein B
MSYILEALRRSQAERERGQVPGLNAQPAAVAALPSQREGPPWRWVLPLGALALGALVLAVWAWRGATGAAPAAMPAPAATGAPPALEPAPLPLVVSAPPPPPAAAPAPPTAAAPAAVDKPAALAAAAPRVLRLSELSAEQRRELPSMSLGGSVWSDSALSRFVIVNGQVVREGETAAPGVVVDTIGPKSVRLRWRDLRIELAL